MVSFKKPVFYRTEKFLERLRNMSYSDMYNLIERHAISGCDRLSSVTPVKTGKTARSWNYEIEINQEVATLRFLNDNVVKGVNIAVILQYGHATRNGGYVQGIDYLNEPLKDIFMNIANEIWREVCN